MYNPQQLHECEKEKKKEKRRGPRPHRAVIDTLMTGIGLVASLSSIPQVWKIFETGSVAGISLTTQIISLGAVLAWFSYGIYIRNRPLIITSALSTIVLATVVAQILIFR